MVEFNYNLMLLKYFNRGYRVNRVKRHKSQKNYRVKGSAKIKARSQDFLKCCLLLQQSWCYFSSVKIYSITQLRDHP